MVSPLYNHVSGLGQLNDYIISNYMTIVFCMQQKRNCSYICRLIVYDLLGKPTFDVIDRFIYNHNNIFSFVLYKYNKPTLYKYNKPTLYL